MDRGRRGVGKGLKYSRFIQPDTSVRSKTRHLSLSVVFIPDEKSYGCLRKEANMDQVKIGAFLKELRKEKNLSQEQIADKFNVSSRSVSRWENGNTMPDISLMIEMADYYDVDIRDLLRGERKSEKMDTDLKETLVMVADYTEAEKAKILKKVYICGQGMLITSPSC